MWHDVRIANAAAVSARNYAGTCVLRAATTGTGRPRGLPSVILFSEVSPVSVRSLLRPWGYDVIQLGKIGSPEAGVAIAYRRDIFKAEEPTLFVGSEATSEGGGIRMRPCLTVRLWTEDDRTGLFTAGHVPPQRAREAARRYLGAFLRVGGLRGGDVNTEPGDMRKLARGAKYRAIKVLGLLVPKFIKARRATPVNIGSDHPAVDVPVLLPRRPKLALTNNPWRLGDA